MPCKACIFFERYKHTTDTFGLHKIGYSWCVNIQKDMHGYRIFGLFSSKRKNPITMRVFKNIQTGRDVRLLLSLALLRNLAQTMP